MDGHLLRTYNSSGHWPMRTLNHSSMFCKNPIAGHQEFVVLHSNGIHKVAVDYCGCERQITFHRQLLRCGVVSRQSAVPKNLCDVPFVGEVSSAFLMFETIGI